MQIMNTYSINPKKLVYKHPNKIVVKRVTHMFNILDIIILGKSINETHVISGDDVKLLQNNEFESKLNRINLDSDLFDRYQSICYILIKNKYFNAANFMDKNYIFDDNNNIIIFFTRSVIKFIENDQSKFNYVMNKLPLQKVFELNVEILWKKYNIYLMHQILIKYMLTYIYESIYDYRKICTYCKKISDVTFIRCINCRVTNYCSNICLFYDMKEHKKICLSIYD